MGFGELMFLQNIKLSSFGRVYMISSNSIISIFKIKNILIISIYLSLFKIILFQKM